MKPDHEVSRQRRAQRRAREAGLCTQCGNPAIFGRGVCESCKKKRQDYYQKNREKFLAASHARHAAGANRPVREKSELTAGCWRKVIDRRPSGDRTVLTLTCGHEVARMNSHVAINARTVQCRDCRQSGQLDRRGADEFCDRRPWSEPAATQLAEERGLAKWQCATCSKWHIGSAPDGQLRRMETMLKEGKR